MHGRRLLRLAIALNIVGLAVYNPARSGNAGGTLFGVGRAVPTRHSALQGGNCEHVERLRMDSR
jgi:hypothetical protein